MVIILVIGSHPAIPKVEINAIIAMRFFIVNDMIGDSFFVNTPMISMGVVPPKEPDKMV